jgi:hypothetical protein
LILTPFAISPAPTPKHVLDAAAGQEASIESWVLETHRAGGRRQFALPSMSEDHKGVAAFLERRKPRFSWK